MGGEGGFGGKPVRRSSRHRRSLVVATRTPEGTLSVGPRLGRRDTLRSVSTDSSPVPAIALDGVPGRMRAPLAGRAGGERSGAGLAPRLIVPRGLADGGYFGRSSTALTAALAASAALVLVRTPAYRPSRPLVATTLALVLLSAWVALSSLWAAHGSGVELETRRCVL